MPWRADEENCPRGDGGTLTKNFDPTMATDPRDSMPSTTHYVCSVCDRWWKTIELKRIPG